MIEERSVFTAECDGCGRIQYSEDGMHKGYAGTIRDVGHGNYGGDWFACRLRCITKAMRHALTRAYHGMTP